MEELYILVMKSSCLLNMCSLDMLYSMQLSEWHEMAITGTQVNKLKLSPRDHLICERKLTPRPIIIIIIIIINKNKINKLSEVYVYYVSYN